MDGASLTPESKSFAAEAVARGRYRDIDDVVLAGVRLLRRAAAARAAFIASLEAAEAEGEREGFATIEQVERDMDDIIEAAEHRRA